MADENTPQDEAPQDAPQAPAPGTPEYDAAKAAEFDAAAAAAQKAGEGGELEQSVQRPDNIPEEFWDSASGTVKTDALLDFYNQTKAAQSETPKKDGETPQDAPKEGGETPKEGSQEAPKGIDMQALNNEFAEKGQLSDESYEKLAKAGFDKTTVDAFIEGQQAISRERVAAAHEVAGGPEAYSNMTEWAKTGLNRAELDAYNTAVGGSHEEMLQAVNGLKARYESEFGRPPRLLGGNGSGNTPGGYESQQQMVDDMRDPRYARDPAFRAKVTRRIALSNF